MAIDFLGQNLSVGDDVVFLNYKGTSADLERGTITKVFEHTAEIGIKRRAEYKIIKIPADSEPTFDAVTVVRCRDCNYRGQVFCPMIHETMGNGLLDYTVDNGYCNRGKRKDTSRSEVR